MATKNLNPLIVILGETASGKSDLALEIAKLFDGEIIAADSWTVYKDFNIGTAKPSKIHQKQIKHHLVDIVSPQDGFNVAQFKRLASKSIVDITNRNKIPILTGGSGLYIDSVVYDYSFLSAGTTERRNKLNKLSLEELMKIIHRQHLDTSGIDLRNKRRLTRLIETAGKRPTKNMIRPNTLIIGLMTSKEDLEIRIANRLDQMLKTGLEQEVKQHAKTYGWKVEPMKGIGYREWEDYLTGQQNLDITVERIIRSTMQLAKKQRTWFKRNKSIHWVSDKAQVVELVTTYLNK